MNWSNIQSFSRSEKGVTLIEVVVVMAIIAILSLVTIGIIVSLFDSSIRTAKYLDQNTTIETMYGFLASRLSVTQVGQVGIPTSDGTKIRPLTLAGDQFMFQSSGGSGSVNNNLCYRMFYIDEPIEDTLFEQGDSIWVSTASDCNDIMPTRGPSQPPASVSEPDPILDAESPPSTFMLAAKIKSNNPKYASAPGGPNQCGGAGNDPSFTSPLQFFFFCSGALDPLAIDGKANSTSTNAFYNDSSNLASIRGVQSVAYVDSGVAPKVPMRAYSQVFSLGQVQMSCAIEGGDAIEVDMTPEPWSNVGTTGNASFTAGWQNAGGEYSRAGYYKDQSGVVHLRGGVYRASGSSLTIFTLPVDYRPKANESLLFPVVRLWNGTGTDSFPGNYSIIKINASGQVYFASGSPRTNYYEFLDGISFRP